METQFLSFDKKWVKVMADALKEKKVRGSWKIRVTKYFWNDESDSAEMISTLIVAIFTWKRLAKDTVPRLNSISIVTLQISLNMKNFIRKKSELLVWKRTQKKKGPKRRD